MNLLEHYIKKVISIKPIPKVDWIDQQFFEVTMVVNCYGHEEEYTCWFGEKEWETVAEQGYFMA